MSLCGCVMITSCHYVIISSVTNSSYGLNFVKIRAKYRHILAKKQALYGQNSSLQQQIPKFKIEQIELFIEIAKTSLK